MLARLSEIPLSKVVSQRRRKNDSTRRGYAGNVGRWVVNSATFAAIIPSISKGFTNLSSSCTAKKTREREREARRDVVGVKTRIALDRGESIFQVEGGHWRAGPAVKGRA